MRPSQPEFKETIKLKKAELSAEYPELSGNANAAGFNVIAKAAVMRSLAGFRKDLAGMTAADLRRYGKDMSNYIDVSYNVEYADEDLISVNFSEETFEGGAHGNHGTFTLTYDLKAGRELKLADLFKPVPSQNPETSLLRRERREQEPTLVDPE